MPSTVQLREGYDSTRLRGLSRRSRDPRQLRRLLAQVAVYDGMSRVEAAKVGGMDRQTLRDWARRFNEAGIEGLRDRPHTSRPRQRTDTRMEELAEIVEIGPDPSVNGVVRWRRIDLKRVIKERFGVVHSERRISDLLVRLSVSYISGRPQHPHQDESALEAFKNYRPPPVCKAERPDGPFQSASIYPAFQRVLLTRPRRQSARAGPYKFMARTLAAHIGHLP